MPERTTPGVYLSFHSDINGQTRADITICAPAMADGYLAFGVEHGVSESIFDLTMHDMTSSVVLPTGFEPATWPL